MAWNARQQTNETDAANEMTTGRRSNESDTRREAREGEKEGQRNREKHNGINNTRRLFSLRNT